MSTFALSPLDPAWFSYLEAVAASALGVGALPRSALPGAVAQVSRVYTRERGELATLRSDDAALCARLHFFLTRDLLKMHGPLAELASVSALPVRETLHVLDVGAGLGAASLGAARFYASHGSARRMRVTAVDLDPEALALFVELSRDLSALPGVPMQVEPVVADLSSLTRARGPTLGAPFDLILMSLALNETRGHDDGAVSRAVAYLCELAELLSPDGALVLIEPALRETSRFLHAVRDELAAREQGPHLFAPCLRRGPCPMLGRERDFCHERVPFTMPRQLAELAEGAGLRDADLTYSYLTLHRARRSLRELADAPLHRAVSATLPSKGKLELWLCGDESAPRAMRLDRHLSEHNRSLEHVGRGTILRFDALRVEARSSGESARIGPDTRVDLLQRWSRAPEPGT